MTTERDDILKALHEFETAIATLCEDAQTMNKAVTRVAALVEKDTPMSDIARRENFGSVRRDLSEHLDHLEQTRKAFRVLTFRAMLEEGHPIAEIAKMWGVSRQLVSRTLRQDNWVS